MTSETETNEKQTTAVTNYLVQQKQTFYLNAETPDETAVDAWVDLGNYEAPSGNRRKAIEHAMIEHDIEEGSFHAIPETSQAVETCRIERKLVWS